MLDYKLIQALNAVVECGGFDKAARALHLTQSAVSQRVKLLEEQTGQVLLARTAPPRPTSAGTHMLKHFAQVKLLEEELQNAVFPGQKDPFVTFGIGVNVDSLDTWFFDAMTPLLRQENLLFDLRTDDQEVTHQMLKDGKVSGCISSQSTPVQGTKLSYLGTMDYRLMAAPAFFRKWFANGLDTTSACQAPAVIFNRKDNLHNKMWTTVFGTNPPDLALHCIPTTKRYIQSITNGFAYGMMPDQQSARFTATRELIDLAPGKTVSVALYWHCWNIKSRILEKVTQALVAGARRLLLQKNPAMKDSGQIHE